MTSEIPGELVNLLYRGILRRDPDPAGHAHFTAMLQNGASIGDLLRMFVDSPEYDDKQLVSHSQMLPQSGVPLGAPAMVVECQASPSEFARLISRVSGAWARLGREHPYFSVLTSEEFLPENLTDASVDKFWASGNEEAAGIRAILARHGLAKLAALTCVEYGCGLGRVTQPLAKTFKHVDAYDISPPHLAFARERAAGYANIEFHDVTSDIFDTGLRPCDVFYSRIVFQHNPPPVISELIRLLLRALRPGGIAIFQVPTYGDDYSFNIDEYLARDGRLDMELHAIPQEQVIRLISEADCRLLELREDNSIGLWGRWISNTFIVQR